MAKFGRNFIAGRMNKIMDERLLPDGEYIDAMNIRMGSTEKSEVGVIENSRGNIALTTLYGPDGVQLGQDARCIGAIEDSANETLYWFVHDGNFPAGPTGKCDLIVSYNVLDKITTYNVISVDDGSGTNTTLNFNPKYLITGVNIIGDLLFFTDNYNPPRFINIKGKYTYPIGGIDQFTAERLLVIKKPPVQSPTVVPIITNGQSNYMDTRFISFAYRYKYVDGEYSATSQWSQVAFVPNPFEFSINSMLNEGMTNVCNAANITYNTGGPLVVGIDLLFKQSTNNVIKVIEKFDKVELGIPNNIERQYQFSNSKIFTVLSEGELLRLYDNVPRFAQAQTIMGNRLMYGNYIDGYNLIDKFGSPIKLEYFTSLITKAIGSSIIPDTRSDGNYTIDTTLDVTNAIGSIDLSGIDLISGSSITIQMTIAHSQFSGDTPFPTETTDSIGVDFSFFLTRNYTSVYELATSPEFQAAIGTSLPAGNIKPVYSAVPGAETSCDGTTFTDDVNCILPNNLDALQKVGSGISAVGQGIGIVTSPASSEIGFQFIAMKYVDDVTTPTKTVYEYYTVTFISAIFQEISTPQSLHSNRGYEIGIVYMDEFNRSTTALVSQNNTEHVPCGYSANKNGIQVTIPKEQRAPVWAKRYKFVIKPDEEFYETVYCNLFFTDPNTNEVWFFLEGENTKKVEVGDRLIVKSDTSGPVLSCSYATVLEKASKTAGFIEPTSKVKVLAGVYMKINPNSFNAVVDPNATIGPGEITVRTSVGLGNVFHVKLNYPMNIEREVGYDPLNPTWIYEDYSVPAGSKIQIKWDWNREGTGSCTHLGYLLETTYVASRDYDNMYDWFVGDNIESTLNNGTSKDGTTKLEYLPTNGILTAEDFFIMYLQFYRNPTTNELILQYSSGQSCKGSSDKRRYYIKVTTTVFRALDTIIFETEPRDASPDIFFENNLSFGIDEDGNHMGNVQDQDIAGAIPGIVDTKFFNCFAFGNGAESYKIRDSIIGRGFSLGERVTTVSAQDYKEADRFADITYSGIYNAETNVNKLNEFNLGLLNYKNLERSFGTIYTLDGRQTDILVLQEDKISYVLAGKNLLSDSTGGGVISSVPEVLGTQIARTEKYGISFNPESYVQWGSNRYFTDIKRGAVLNIKGDSMSQDQLIVISEANMRTWFRDEFNTSFNTQKLGAYDPYMNEYVLSSNDILTPIDAQCLNCGISQTFNFSGGQSTPKTFNYCVDLGALVGEVNIDYNVQSIIGDDFTISVTYNGNTYSSGQTSNSGELTFTKDSISVETAEISIFYLSDSLVIDVIVKCPTPEELNIVEVVLTNNTEFGDSNHIQYRYTNGTFIGPLQSAAVTFGTKVQPPVVSRYNVISGFAGNGAFPPEASTMQLISNSIPPDTFVFDTANDKFRYLRSSTLYPNTTVGINALIAASTLATPITGTSPAYSSTFVVPNKSLGDYLYLIWDYRNSIPLTLCYADTTGEDPIKDVCCNCSMLG